MTKIDHNKEHLQYFHKTMAGKEKYIVITCTHRNIPVAVDHVNSRIKSQPEYRFELDVNVVIILSSFS